MKENNGDDLSGGEILAVADSPADLRLLTGILTEAGFKVRPVDSGHIALETVGTRLPDLMLLDIKMPDPDGFEVCRRLKADESTRDIPVVFISALADTAEKIRTFEVGGVDYVTKPFQKEEVLARFPDRVVYVGGGPPVWDVYAPYIRHWDINRLPYDGEADRWFDPGWLVAVDDKA